METTLMVSFLHFMLPQVQRGTVTVPTSDTVVAGTSQIVFEGELSNLIVSVPALEGTGTATILGTDSIGGTIYASTAIAESAIARIAPIGTPTYFAGTLYLSATTANATDGTQSANRNVSYNLYYGAKHG